MVVDVSEGTESAPHPAAKRNVGICAAFQQFLHCLGRLKKQVQERKVSGHVLYMKCESMFVCGLPGHCHLL